MPRLQPIIDGRKRCTKCGETKPVSEFGKATRISSGLRPNCKACNNAVGRRYYEENRDARIEWGRAFNKTEHRREYARGYQAARWRRLRDEVATHPRPETCEICDSPGLMCFDHRHDTGAFRGWLCNRCNRVLGLCADDPELMRSMAVYLERADASNRYTQRDYANGNEKIQNWSAP